MTMATVVCRNLVWFQTRIWPRRLVTQQPVQLYKTIRQYTAPLSVMDSIVEEKKVDRNLKKQILNGNVVKIALGQDPPKIYGKKLGDYLSNCQSVEQILESCMDQFPDLDSNGRLKVLNRIRMICVTGENPLKKDELEEIFNDERFSELLNGFDVEMEISRNLVLIMENLLPLSETNTKFTDSVQKRIQRDIPKMKFGILVRLMTNCAKHRETAVREQIYEISCSEVKKRWVEISDPQQLLSLIETLAPTSPGLYLNLQNKALSLTDQMNRKQLLWLLNQLNLTNQRNVPLLKNLTHHLLEKGLGNEVSVLKSLLIAFAKLNVYDQRIITEATTSLYSNLHLLKRESPNSLSRILFSCTRLGHKYVELIDSIVDILMPSPEESEFGEEEIVDKLPVEIITSTIVSCGLLNHMPERWTKGCVLNMCVKRLQNAELDPKVWLNMVYALVSLGVADESSVASVLSRAADRKEWANFTSYWKLRDINFSSLHEMKSYTGPYLTDDFLADTRFTKVYDPHKRLLHTRILKTLENSFPSEKYFTADFKHPSGLTIDIHMVVNVMGELQPVENYQSGEKLPQLNKLVAVVPLDYADMTKCSVGPNDVKSLYLRHLKILGYNVVQVPHKDWADLTTAAKRSEYLFRKIKEAVI